MSDRHIEEAFSAVPSAESGQFAEYRNGTDDSLNGYLLICGHHQGCESFLYSYSGSPEPSREYSTDRLTLLCMPD